MLEGLRLAYPVWALCREVERLEGAMQLVRPDDKGVPVEVVNRRDDEWSKLCRVGELYDLLIALAGKLADVTCFQPNDDSGEWTPRTLPERFGVQWSEVRS